jgi:hypothetical protein
MEPAPPPAKEDSDASKLEERIKVCQMRFASHNANTEQVGELREPAKLAVVDIRESVRDPMPDGMPERIATLFDDEWLVDELFGKPTVAIIVTGGAQDFKMLPRVERVFREGLVKAAQMTNAWVFTGGMATGVMKYVGEALASHPDIPCIGMPLCGNVVGQAGIRPRLCSLEDMRHAKEQMVEYVHSESDNSKAGTALEPHHTHFVLLEAGLSGPAAWGAEIEFALRTQLAYCVHDTNRVPAVLLVVQGGQGTLTTVVQAVKSGVPVVVIADSEGAASAIRDFLTRPPEIEEQISAARDELDRAVRTLQQADTALETAKMEIESAIHELGAAAAKSSLLARRRESRAARQTVDRLDHALLALEQKLLTEDVRRVFEKKELIHQLRILRAHQHLIELFELADNATADISQSILKAVALDSRVRARSRAMMSPFARAEPCCTALLHRPRHSPLLATPGV